MSSAFAIPVSRDHALLAIERAAALSRTVDMVPAYMAYVSPDIRYVFVNDTYVQAFGRPRHLIEGHLVADVLGPSYKNISDHLEAALRGEARDFETRMGTVDAERILAVSHVPDFAPDGTVRGAVVYGFDITDRHRTETALIQSEKLAAVGRMASSIAHEINNPLEAITNLLYLAGVHAISPETQRYLEVADIELRRVTNIVNQTLRFHRQASSPQAVFPSELFETVLSIYEGRLRNSGISVDVLHLAPMPVVCFEGDIRQVLNNLVGNAIDAMPHGGKLYIRTHSVSIPERSLYLTVADTGSGIPRDVLPRIFDAFYTTKGIGGNGLGLWISKDVVDRHGGALLVRSNARGTVFRLRLPETPAA